MAIAQEILETGRLIAAVSAGSLSASLRAGVERYVGWPYKVASASVVDADGAVSDTFAAIVYVAKEKSLAAAPAQIPADSAAVVFDATDSLAIDTFRASLRARCTREAAEEIASTEAGYADDDHNTRRDLRSEVGFAAGGFCRRA